MPKPKVNTRRQFTSASLELKAVMQFYLKKIAETAVAQVVTGFKNLPDAQRLNATKDLKLTGQAEFRRAVQACLGAIASEALENVRKEIPKAKNVRLADEIAPSLALAAFDDLPANIRNKLKAQYTLLTDTQLNGIVRTVTYQYQHSVDSTDSPDQMQLDLEDAVDDYIGGTAVQAGAAATSAQVINDTRNNFFDDPEVQAQIEGFVFVNADPVSEVCTDLAGTVFSVDDPNRFRFTPPLHFNCKSYIEPIVTKDKLDAALKNNDQTDFQPLKPSTKRIENTIQFSEAICGCGENLKVID